MTYARVEWENSCVKVLRRVEVLCRRSNETPLCGSRTEQSQERSRRHAGTLDGQCTAHRDAEKRASAWNWSGSQGNTSQPAQSNIHTPAASAIT